MSESNGWATRDACLTGKRRFIDYEIPRIGKVRIRSLSFSEASLLNDDDSTGTLLTLALCDANGEQLLVGPSDAELILDMDAAIVGPLVEAIVEHVRPDGDAEKNFEVT